MGREDQTVRISWADSASHFARKMTGEPFLDALLCLAKHLKNERNRRAPNEGETCLFKQFPLEPCEKLFSLLNLSAWKSPVMARVAWIGLLYEQQISLESGHCRCDKFAMMV